MAGLVATTLSGSQHDLSNGIQSPSLSYQLVDAVPKWSLLSRKWHGDISSLCTSQGMLLTLDRSWVPLLSGRASRCVLIYLQISKEICSQQVDNIINILTRIYTKTVQLSMTMHRCWMNNIHLGFFDCWTSAPWTAYQALDLLASSDPSSHISLSSLIIWSRFILDQ